MKGLELLAPAGTMEALQAAVQCGCDAVYLGGTQFGARAFAGNFDERQIKEAIRYAHRYGVSVYVTMNTLLYENEMDAAFEYACFLYEQDVDALIVQDIGLADRLHRQLPDLELHASTQMHIHNEAGIETARRLGMKRVVLPRESRIEEIRALAQSGMELEAFVHGALCVCYSGQCLMSAALLQRSGNRGACAQPCRMQYALWRHEGEKAVPVPCEGRYLLSPKDLFTVNELPQLIEAGVRSFKIEGRMKKPEYVAQAVSLYRQALDAYRRGEPFHVGEAQIHELEKVFSRGFTKGYAFHQPLRAILDAHRPNHRGVALGTVIGLDAKRIRLRLCGSLRQGDGIRVLGNNEDQGCVVNRLYQNGLLVKQAEAGSVVEIDRKIEVRRGSEVRKTSDTQKLAELASLVAQKNRRVALDLHVSLTPGEPLHVRAVDEEGFRVDGDSEAIVQQAQNAPLDEARLRAAFAKMNDTPFVLRRFCCEQKGACFLPVKAVNELRRTVLMQLQAKREHRRHKQPPRPYDGVLLTGSKPRALFASVETAEQYEACKQAGIALVYTPCYSLYRALREAGEPIGFHEGNVVSTRRNAQMGGENGALALGRPVLDSTLNLTNSYAVAAASSFGAQTFVLSLEHSLSTIQELIEGCQTRYGKWPDLAVMVYGYRDLMTSACCVINANLKDGTKQNCRLCREHVYSLTDLKQNRFFLHNDEECRMRILNCEPDDRMAQLAALRKMGVASFYLRFTIESKAQTARVLNRFEKACKFLEE